MRKTWLALLLWHCLSGVLLLLLQMKSVQILEEFCLHGGSLCSICQRQFFLACRTVALCFCFLYLDVSSTFWKVFLVGFISWFLHFKEHNWVRVGCHVYPAALLSLHLPACLMQSLKGLWQPKWFCDSVPAEIQNSRLSGRWQHLLPLLVPVPVLCWRNWVASFS